MKKQSIPVLLFIFLCLSSCSQIGKKESRLSFEAMDTWMSIQCYGKNSDDALELVKGEIIDLEKLISTTDKESQIWKLNTESENKTFLEQKDVIGKVSPELVQLADFSLIMAERTEGAFNPCLYPVTKAWGFTTESYTVPSKTVLDEKLQLTDYTKVKIQDAEIILPAGMQFDFGGIGKGYTGDRVIKTLQIQGMEYGILDLGGNVQAFGSKKNKTPWKIGIKNPVGEGLIAGLSIKDGAVITSGGYQRFFTVDDGKEYIHIIDSNTGYPVDNGLVSVTIVASSGAYADALSTALFVMGEEKAIAFWKDNKNQVFDFILMKQIYSDSEEIKLKVVYSDTLNDKIQIIETGIVEEIEIVSK